jgi:hypothetical protein
MRINLHKALLLLSILCIGITLTGIVLAEGDQGGETYGAYPGAPIPVVGQSGSVGGRTESSTTTTAVYTTQAPPATQQNVLLSYNVQASPPSAVYYSGTYMPWTSFYQVFPANSPAFWVASSAGWSWYATCPVGGWIQNLMYVPYTGTMKLYEFYPDGSVKLYSYGFAAPGYKYIWFYADTPGRHVTLFTVFDKPSNYITIDVA